LLSEKPTVIHIGSTTLSAIEAALRALPIKDPDRTNVIPYSVHMPGIARHVLLMRRPNNMKSMRKRAMADLDKIMAGAAKLADLIDDQFPNEQKDLANPRIRITTLLPVAAVEEAIQLHDSLKQFVATAERARNQHFEVTSRGHTRKTEALEVGIYLYKQFALLTGKKPTRTVRNGKTIRHPQVLTKRFGLIPNPSILKMVACFFGGRRRG
jgi:hypothetical protein